MPISSDGIHMLRTAALRLIEEISTAAAEDTSEDSLRQIRALCGALMASLPMTGFRGGPPTQVQEMRAGSPGIPPRR